MVENYPRPASHHEMDTPYRIIQGLSNVCFAPIYICDNHFALPHNNKSE